MLFRGWLWRKTQLPQQLTRLPLQSTTRYDVVCANLQADLLIPERRRIVNRVQPGGRLVLAGILSREYAAIRQAFRSLRWKQVATAVKKEWQSGTFIWRRVS